MRTLDFIVSGQAIKRDPRCDFGGIVAGSRGYLRARFRFSADWSGCKKVAVFSPRDGQEHPAAIINGVCEIPAEALTGTAVQVTVVGRKDGYQISTATTAFPQTLNNVNS